MGLALCGEVNVQSYGDDKKLTLQGSPEKSTLLLLDTCNDRIVWAIW